ncbi:MAG: DciA family protein [Candidatus Kuenenbacteria bacterium]
MFHSLSKFLPLSLKKAKIEKQVEATMVCQEFDLIIQNIWDEKILDQVKAISLKDKVLTVAILSSVLASELQLRQEEIIKKINFKLKKNVVDRLRFLI